MAHTLSSMVTYDQAITAMTLWELILEEPSAYPGVEAYRSDNGVCETRDRVFEMAGMACTLWDVMNLNDWYFDAPFDFEYLPVFLKHCTNAQTGKGGGLYHTVDPETVREVAFQLYQWSQADQTMSMAAQNLRSLTQNTGMGLVGRCAPAREF